MPLDTEYLKLAAPNLKSAVAPDSLGFTTTDELEPFAGFLGHRRAQDALHFGVAMGRPGYNVFVMGETGTGRLSLVQDYLEAVGKEMPPPGDWLYLNNFAEPREPLALRLGPGQGRALQRDIENLADSLLALFPTAFENPTYQQRKTAIDREFSQRYSQSLTAVERKAQEYDIAVFRDGENVSFTPLQDGKPLDESGFAQLPEGERAAFHRHVQSLEDFLADTLAELPQWKRETTERLRQLNQDTVRLTVEPLLHDLEEKYADEAEVLGYLAALRADLSRVINEQLTGDQEPREDYAKRQLLINQYVPKLLVAHDPQDGAPAVYESYPCYGNLFGRVEYVNDQGALVTHYRLISGGALHRANGGYLVLEAEKLLAEANVWPALKRALQTRTVKIETPAPGEQASGLMTLDPQIIPLDVKLVLVGSREVYYLLQELDEEFGELFRVLADFDDAIARNDDTLRDFARLVKTRNDADGGQPLSAAAMAMLAEYSSRLAEHQQQLSARLSEVFQLVSEADLLRGQRNDPAITDIHLRLALHAKEQRTGRISRQVLDDMLDSTILVATEGQAIGQINGLTVLAIGDTSFGMPARITATVYPGSRGVVDIEREAELGQAIHSKGVMILAGYLGSRYAQRFPLAISANIALEQSYGYIDGDSAALAELCALISAITRQPLKQTYAVTGSINQQGEVQAVGGINEKIEGFFHLCQARGLNSNQGVIIPKANQRNLMLKEEVITAVEQGRFVIYAVARVDEALELLTGLPAGARDQHGLFPENTVNGMAVARLETIARVAVKKRGGARHGAPE
ncbi:Lon protease family protein [Methylogaea oryzae]|uniref:endopeptidase La n=2 Tax=Methylogaea oryzae TaxID=1295382 RepID=A0A8D4VRG8_9GAMM|nr:ATP-binding protein [Methylogaea oryzae]BBL72785.1 ATP-dependent protease [Methylogaea oryzae]